MRFKKRVNADGSVEKLPFTVEEELVRDAEEAADRGRELANSVLVEFQTETSEMTAKYTQAEIDTFSTQEAEARAYSSDNSASTPLIDAIISESGDTKEDLVSSILAKSNALKVGVGRAIGRKRKKLKP